VPNAHSGADTDWEFLVDVDGNPVLDVGSEPDLDLLGLRAQCRRYQTLALAARLTFPIRLALGATQDSACS